MAELKPGRNKTLRKRLYRLRNNSLVLWVVSSGTT